MKEKFKVISEGLTKGRIFDYIADNLESKVKDNPSIDLGSLEYNNLFQVYVRQLMVSPNPDVMNVLLILGIIIAMCDNDYKPLTIAEVSYLSLYCEEKSLTEEDVKKLNDDLVNTFDLITGKEFTWNKFGIGKITLEQKGELTV